MKRKSGILLPIFSLWGKEQIGTLGAEAFAFVDCLSRAGQSHWQVLPAGPTRATPPLQATPILLICIN